MADIFISYARADREKIEKLASALEAEGHSVWWDRNIVGGSEFSHEIEKELTAAKAVIVAWSEVSVKSRWVRDEAGTAAEAGKLIPVGVDGTHAPMGFKQYHVIDLDGWNGKPAASEFQDVARAVNARVTGEAAAAPAATKKNWLARLRSGGGKASDSPLNTLIKYGAIVVIVYVAVVLGGPKDRDEDSGTPPATETAEVVDPASITSHSANAVEAATIAVLPFADLSPEGDHEYFADGIAEEILNALAPIDGLRLASRTSAFAYKKSQLRIPAIASELGVRHVLEGSVRRSGDTIRITAQLIDAQTDKHLYSETFDRTLTAENVFAIQSEIATAIVEALSGQIDMPGGGEAPLIVADTDNLETLDLYYEATALYLARGRGNLTRSATLFEDVVARDPEFARGWSGLAQVYTVAEDWGLPARNYNTLARSAAERAIALNPDLASPYAVLAAVETNFFRWSESLNHFNKALSLNPRDPNIYNWRALIWTKTGFSERAMEDYETCFEIDPAYLNCGYNLSNELYLLGRIDEAAALDADILKRGEGQQLWSEARLHYLVKKDDRLGVLVALNQMVQDSFPSEKWIINELYNAYFDPNYDHQASLEPVLARFAAAGDDLLSATPRDVILRAYGRHDQIYYLGGWPQWIGYYPGVEKETIRQLIIRDKMPAFWREFEFPPQCRPVGDNDFECD